MKRSSQRILTTHIGSLPRPEALWELIDAKDKNRAYDQSALNTQLRSAVTAMVRSRSTPESIFPRMANRVKPVSQTTCVSASADWRESIPSATPEPPSKYPAYDEAMRTRGPSLRRAPGNSAREYGSTCLEKSRRARHGHSQLPGSLEGPDLRGSVHAFRRRRTSFLHGSDEALFFRSGLPLRSRRRAQRRIQSHHRRWFGTADRFARLCDDAKPSILVP